MIAWLLACASPDDAAPPPAADAAPTAPDFVLVGIAGLRGDVPSGAGSAFAAAFPGASVYDAAYAQSVSRFTSWGSLLAGRYPSAIPLCGIPSGADATATPWCNTFPKERPSLPEVLALYGWRTALLATDLPGQEHLRRLFQDVLDADTPGVANDWTALASVARAWWDADATRPRLLVVATADALVQERPDLLASTGLAGVRPNERGDADRVSTAFSAEAARLGKEVAGFVNALPTQRPRWTFAFGTYGQRLGDIAAPWQALGDTQPWSDVLLERTLHVPLVLSGPGVAARHEPRVVELVDVVPTVARLAGVVPPAELPGADLCAPSAGPDTAYAEFGDMLAVRAETRLYAVRGYFHYRSSLDPELTNFLLTPPSDDNKHYLHDVVTDPMQAGNLVRHDPEGARRMHALMSSIRLGVGAPPRDALDARRAFDLRMLPSEGYW